MDNSLMEFLFQLAVYFLLYFDNHENGKSNIMFVYDPEFKILLSFSDWFLLKLHSNICGI